MTIDEMIFGKEQKVNDIIFFQTKFFDMATPIYNLVTFPTKYSKNIGWSRGYYSCPRCGMFVGLRFSEEPHVGIVPTCPNCNVVFLWFEKRKFVGSLKAFKMTEVNNENR